MSPEEVKLIVDEFKDDFTPGYLAEWMETPNDRWNDEPPSEYSYEYVRTALQALEGEPFI